MKYKRILLKLSGEFLSNGSGFSPDRAEETAGEIVSSVSGVQTAVLVGGGNVIRARTADGVSRLAADYMGMTATLINAIGLKDAFEKVGIESRIVSTVTLEDITEPVNPAKTVKYLEEGKMVIFAGGTGSPFFTTDTAAALRALEIKAEAVLKATNVDGVYDRDPQKDKDARLIEGPLSITEAISRNFQIMDTAAFSLLKNSGINIVVFNFKKRGALKNILEGKNIGTIVK